MIIKKRAEGKSTRQIAEEVGVDKMKVSRRAKETGVSNDTPEVTGKDGKKLDEHPEASGPTNFLHCVRSCRTVQTYGRFTFS